MTRPRARSGSDLPFRYVGGDPSLDLVNTVDWTAGGLSRERLTDYDRLLEWGIGARLVSRSGERGLRWHARSRPDAAVRALAEAHRLRMVLRRVCGSIHRREAHAVAWRDFNGYLSEALRRLRLAPRRGKNGSPGAVWAWADPTGTLEAPLWPVIWSAARLLVSDEGPRIRTCGGPDCGWMYVDRSRNGLRRWCEMATCGTEQKSRNRRAKRHRTGAAPAVR